MDRRSLIKRTGIAGVLAAGVAPAVHAQAAVRWRLASSFPKSLDTIFGSAEKFSQTVKALSGGKFEVSVHPAGELMPAFGVVASLVGLGAVIISGGIEPEEQTVTKANEQDVVLCKTSLSTYEVAGRLYQLDISGK